jgi:predicted nucleic acid-binding protein
MLLDRFVVTVITQTTIEKAFVLSLKYGFSYWDSLIISSAIENGCNILYSEDMQHEQLIEKKLRIINPFLSF